MKDNERLQRSVFKQARSYCGNVINADFLEMLKKRDNKEFTPKNIIR